PLIAHGLSFPMTLFEVSMKFFKDVQIIKPITYPSSGAGLPTTSRTFARTIPRVNQSNVFLLNWKMSEIYLLKAPYDTSCVPSSSRSKSNCTTECLVKDMIDRLDRIPFTEIITEDDWRGRG